VKLVEIVKAHDKNRPLTICRITANGRKRYLEYLSTLEQVVRDAAEAEKEEAVSQFARRLGMTAV
jgi:Winged helix DNA-binding domain